MTRPRAVCAGEITIDRIALRAAPSLAAEIQEHVGGAPVNVAAGLQSRGIDAVIWSAVGWDDAGREATRQIARLGLSTDAIGVDRAHPTRIASIQTTSDGTRTTRVTPAETADHFLNAALLPSAVESCRIFYLSGAALIGASTAEAVLTALRLIKEREDTVIAFDPNIRLGNSAVADAIRRRFHSVLPFVDVLQFASERAPEYWPSGEPAVLRDLTLRIETNGAQGARLSSRHASVQVAPEQTAAVDTTGAGDAFLASVLADLVATPDPRGTRLELETLRRWGDTAATAAARVIRFVGGSTAYLSSGVATPS